MATFRKVTEVDARKYKGPNLPVMNDQLGEQHAVEGDYLVGTEKGKIRVVPAKEFEADYEPYTLTATDDKLKASQATIAEFKTQLKDAIAAKDAADTSHAASKAQNAELIAKQNDAVALQSKVDGLTAELEAAKKSNTVLQSKVDKLNAIEDSRAAAQKQIDAAEAALKTR